LLEKLGVGERHFRKTLPDCYHDLCAFVHLLPKATNYDIELIFPDFNEQSFTSYYDKVVTILTSFEILLFVKFPGILGEKGLVHPDEHYTPLRLSKEQCDAIVDFSKKTGTEVKRA
jgi:hypothetical protein